MNYSVIAERIIELEQADLELRDRLLKSGKLGKSYNEEMAALHESNARQLEQMIGVIGYPTIDKVGRRASAAAWLIIQHAIGQPNFMRRCCQLLEEAVKAGQADPVHLAYLSDRIAVFEGNVQRYGTQFDWDEDGMFSPQMIDDRAKVNERRRSIGLNTLEEQTQLLWQRVNNDNQSPPRDVTKRRQNYEAWRKFVGWIDYDGAWGASHCPYRQSKLELFRSL